MSNRTLRYAYSPHLVALTDNMQHELAHDHAISIFRPNAVYSMIPKNGCSSLRLSIAMANGAIDSLASWRWIHSNNSAFKPSLRELSLADFTFTFLRCPHARLVSCFLDKIVSRTADAWQFHAVTGEAVALPRLTFRRFCTEMASPRVKHSNVHWRPQVDFLVYKEYDQLYCVEDFAAATRDLGERIGLKIVDSRPLVRHDAGQYQILPPAAGFADKEVWELEAMMMKGLRPHSLSFYDDGLRELVMEAYREDHRLFHQLFSGRGLFDQSQGLAATG